LHYSLTEQSPALQERIRQNLKSHLESGRASLVHGRIDGKGTASAVPDFQIKRALAPEVPLIVFANELFDAIPVEVVSSQGKLGISCQKGRFEEIWAPLANEEMQFLENYSVRPQSRERLEVSSA